MPSLLRRLPAFTAEAQDRTAEQVAELTIFANGGRAILAQIRRNGFERGKLSTMGREGRTDEGRYELRFVRGEKSAKDKVRLDRKSNAADYSLVYGEGRVWGIINGVPFTPRQEATADFLSEYWHSIDALLRYKENESKLNLLGKDKHQGIELYTLELTDKENRRTRYYISARTFHVLWLEYEETPPGAAAAVKYTKKFYDYRVAQGTLVPYRTVLLEDGKQSRETRILTVTFGVKMVDSIFQNPEAPASAANP